MDAENIGKIITEVLDNALKFSNSGTAIQVEGRSDTETTYRLTVSDKGRGMTPVQLSQIRAGVQFDRDYIEQQGSGLGLVIVKLLLDLHGGRIDVEGAEGRGTTVRMSLPIARSSDRQR